MRLRLVGLIDPLKCYTVTLLDSTVRERAAHDKGTAMRQKIGGAAWGIAAALAAVAPVSAQTKPDEATIDLDVTAKRLDRERSSILPSLGATRYDFSRTAIQRLYSTTADYVAKVRAAAGEHVGHRAGGVQHHQAQLPGRGPHHGVAGSRGSHTRRVGWVQQRGEAGAGQRGRVNAGLEGLVATR